MEGWGGGVEQWRSVQELIRKRKIKEQCMLGREMTNVTSFKREEKFDIVLTS